MRLGTPLYFAPEIAYGQECGKELDLWTLGVFAYELANFVPPFELNQILNKNTFKKVVLDGESKRQWKN